MTKMLCSGAGTLVSSTNGYGAAACGFCGRTIGVTRKIRKGHGTVQIRLRPHVANPRGGGR